MAQLCELNVARKTVAELRMQVQQLQAAAPLGQRQSPTQLLSMQCVRTTDGVDAPYTGRSLEFMRRIVDEANVSFEGAATANALILQWHFGDEVPESHLTNATAFRRSFLRAGIADEEAAAARNTADTGPWSIANCAGCRWRHTHGCDWSVGWGGAAAYGTTACCS